MVNRKAISMPLRMPMSFGREVFPIMFKTRNKMLALLALFACAAMLFCACVPAGAPDDSLLNSLAQVSSEDSTSKPNQDVLAQDEYLTVLDVVSITPKHVAVYGKLTEAAVAAGVDSVRLTGPSDLEVQEVCDGNYFIIPVDLPGQTRITLSATAMKGDEKMSEGLSFSAPYDSTAEPRLDGKSVSVGTKSRLYFSKYLDNYLSKELYTASQLKEIKATIASTLRAYTDRAKGNEVALIYVLLPDLATMDPSILREEDVAEKNDALATRYDQILQTVGGTKAKLVDMRAILQAELNNGKDIYDLYRKTDSHPTEYTSFLMYQEVMKYMMELDSDLQPHTLDDYTMKRVDALGGDYVTYRGLDPNVVREEITLLEPKFAYRPEVGSIKLYNDTATKDYSLFLTMDSTDNYTGGAERTVISTERTELPNVLIYRDENTIGASLMVAESCDQTLLARIGDYYISLTDAGQYRDKEEGKSVMDFIVVFVSESNLGEAF